jgi:hypothetical protein
MFGQKDFDIYNLNKYKGLKSLGKRRRLERGGEDSETTY